MLCEILVAPWHSVTLTEPVPEAFELHELHELDLVREKAGMAVDLSFPIPQYFLLESN